MRRSAVLLAVLPLLASSGCSGGNAAGKTRLNVLAASSLTESFTQLEGAFEKDHPEVDVVISFGSSTTLAEQIVAGAPADVIATADATSISIVEKKQLLALRPVPFATNTMTIATPPDNPADVHSVSDLEGADYVMCDVSAPCGVAGQEVLDQAGVTAQPRSFEADAKSVLSKVTLGEADAGLVYVTDARAAGSDVATVPIPTADNAVNEYYIATVKGASPPAGAWMELVTSAAGEQVLKSGGFGLP